MKKSKLQLVAICALLFCSTISYSQSLKADFVSQDSLAEISFEFLKPFIEGSDGLKFYSGVYDISARIPVSPSLKIVASLPVLTFSVDGFNETGIGNAYLGIEKLIGSADDYSSGLMAGIYLPTESNSEASQTGAFINYSELQKYISDYTTIQALYSYQTHQESGFLWGLSGGLNLFLSSEEFNDTEALLNYNLKLGYRSGNLAILGELQGLHILTEEGDFGDKNINTINVGFQHLGNNFNVGLYYNRTLDEFFQELVKGSLGIKLNFYIQ